MKNFIRIALPRVSTLNSDTPLPYVLLDRQHTVLRSGELPATALATGMPTRHTQVVLHPADVVHTQVIAPPLTAARLSTAVHSLIEPMVLTSPDDLAIGHGARQADGSVPVAWTARAPLARAWALLAAAGLQVSGFYPTAHIAPATDGEPETPLALPVDDRWRHPAPGWSLAMTELRPATHGDGRWRSAALIGVAAALVWIVGLNLYAGQLDSEARALKGTMQRQVTQAFPDIGIVIDPLKQAQQRRDSLRAAHGSARDDDFLPLAKATASLLPQAAHRVERLSYRAGAITIQLEGDDGTGAPDAGPSQRAGAMGLSMTREESGWRIARINNTGGTDSPGRLRSTPGGVR